ncbi:hypothetical protein GCM10010309_50890 [Streptomyces violaceochromogenes]|nr:hypothetical protein GCM10010309_50890 [Streptomyces violaceochromogenes]
MMRWWRERRACGVSAAPPMKVCRAGGLGFPEVPVPAVPQTGTQRTGPGPGRNTGTIDDVNATAAALRNAPCFQGCQGRSRRTSA